MVGSERNYISRDDDKYICMSVANPPRLIGVETVTMDPDFIFNLRLHIPNP